MNVELMRTSRIWRLRQKGSRKKLSPKLTEIARICEMKFY